MEKILHANGNEKKKSWGSNTSIRQKKDFRTKPISEIKKVIKGLTQQENITLVNTYALNIGTPKYIKKIFIYLWTLRERMTAMHSR